MTNSTMLGAAPSHLHTATSELDLARTIARSLHRARTEAQLVARIATVRACCATARQAAVIGGLAALVTQADDLIAAVETALTSAHAIAA